MIGYLTGPLLGNTRAGWMASAVSIRFSIVGGGLICTAAVLLCIPLLPAFWRYRSGGGLQPKVDPARGAAP